MVNKELLSLFAAYKKEIGMHSSDEAAATLCLAHVLIAVKTNLETTHVVVPELDGKSFSEKFNKLNPNLQVDKEPRENFKKDG